MKSLKTFCLVLSLASAGWASSPSSDSSSTCDQLPLLIPTKAHYELSPEDRNWAMNNLLGNWAQRTAHHLRFLLRATGTHQEARSALVEGPFRSFMGKRFSREDSGALTDARIPVTKADPFDDVPDDKISRPEAAEFILRFSSHADYVIKADRYIAMRKSGFSHVGAEQWLEAKVPGDTLVTLTSVGGAKPQEIQELLKLFQHRSDLIERLQDYAQQRAEGYSHESVLSQYEMQGVIRR